MMDNFLTCTGCGNKFDLPPDSHEHSMEAGECPECGDVYWWEKIETDHSSFLMAFFENDDWLRDGIVRK